MQHFCLNFKIIFDRIRQNSACERSDLLSSASFSLSFVFVRKRKSRTGCIFKEWNIREDRDCVLQYGNRRENTSWIIVKHYLSLISSIVSEIVCNQFNFSNCSNFKRYVYYSYLYKHDYKKEKKHNYIIQLFMLAFILGKRISLLLDFIVILSVFECAFNHSSLSVFLLIGLLYLLFHWLKQ